MLRLSSAGLVPVSPISMFNEKGQIAWAHSRYSNLILGFAYFCTLLSLLHQGFEIVSYLFKGEIAAAAECIGFTVILLGLLVVFGRQIQRKTEPTAEK